jgi:hypothetical protein
VINNNNDVVPSIEPELQQSSTILVDTSTVINETRYDNSKKSDGSSIKININSRQELNEKSHEENSSSKSSNDQQKFKSLVLTTTALKDEQKVNKFFLYSSNIFQMIFFFSFRLNLIVLSNIFLFVHLH